VTMEGPYIVHTTHDIFIANSVSVEQPQINGNEFVVNITDGSIGTNYSDMNYVDRVVVNGVHNCLVYERCWIYAADNEKVSFVAGEGHSRKRHRKT
jgi:hypothetical protein